ncbi:MAG: alpha/beta fold hydrolase [Hyphomonadaceae bacterium]
MTESDEYDEFGFLAESARELGLQRTPPRLARRDLGALSALVWSDGPAELVFLHGGGQNAHTWDSVLLALGRPAVAFDLPGHGRSAWRADHDYGPWRNAEAIAAVLPALAPDARAVIGMSLGGVTALRLAATHPALVRKLVMIDVTPQVQEAVGAMNREEQGSVALLREAPTFASLQAMEEAAITLSPNRSPEAVRRGVRHNAQRDANGAWTWRYDPNGRRSTEDFTTLWDDVSRLACPVMLVAGGASKFVRAEHVKEFRRRQPALRVEHVAGAGHAVQSDKPLELARLIADFTG